MATGETGQDDVTGRDCPISPTVDDRPWRVSDKRLVAAFSDLNALIFDRWLLGAVDAAPRRLTLRIHPIERKRTPMSASPSTPSVARAELAGVWTIDPVHSYVGFVVKHVMVSMIRGQFEQVNGVIVTGERIEDAAVTANIDVASIHTNNEQRNEHLRSADFFDVAHHPTITFASTRFRRTDETVLVDGAFTLHGVTKDITLAATMPAFGGPGPAGKLVVGFSATGSIDRSDFGLDFNVPIPGAGLMLGDRVELVLEIEATLND